MILADLHTFKVQQTPQPGSQYFLSRSILTSTPVYLYPFQFSQGWQYRVNVTPKRF